LGNVNTAAGETPALVTCRSKFHPDNNFGAFSPVNRAYATRYNAIDNTLTDMQRSLSYNMPESKE
jgi:hypothetical protein